MGESFGPCIIGDGVDEQIMKYISSCNIAAGFHAGDPNIMRTSVKNAIENKVNIGVHPGYRDLVGFGRRQIIAKNEELINDCIYQLGALREFINLEGGKLSHFKLHGSLYMFAAKDKEFSQILVDILHKIDFDSICIHSDTPGALSLIKETKDILEKNNIQVKPPQFNF